MPARSKRKSLLAICILGSLLSGCVDEEKGLLRSEWYSKMSETLFLNSDSSLEELRQWGVEMEGDLEQPLSRQEFCLSLRQALGEKEETAWLNECESQGDAAVGLQEAETSLKQLITLLNQHPSSLQKMEHPRLLWLAEDAILKQDGQVETEEDLREGLWFVQDDQIYVMEKDPQSQSLHAVSVDPAQWLEELQLDVSFAADLTQAEIMPLNDSAAEYSLPQAVPAGSQRSVDLYRQQFQFQGTEISWSVSGSGIHVHASRKLPGSVVLQLDFDLDDLHPVLQWKTGSDGKKEGRLQLDFTMSESVGVTRGVNSTLTTDFSGMDPGRLLESFVNSFVRGKQDRDTVIPIASIRIPVPQLPLVDILLQLQLYCYAGGRAELRLSQSGSVGVQIRNGTVRPIAEIDSDHDFILQGSAKMSAAVEAAGRAAGIDLLDLAVQAGIRGVMRTTAYLTQSDGSLVRKEADELPLELQQQIEQPLRLSFCGDLNVHGILELQLNSQKTLAGRWGMGKQIAIWNENNATLNPGGKTHLENGMFVERCTRRTSAAQTVPSALPVTERIELKETQLILNPGETAMMEIIGLPSGLKREDLIFTVEDPATATVVQTGRVQAVRSGSTIITVSEKTGQWQSFCHIFVREEE